MNTPSPIDRLDFWGSSLLAAKRVRYPRTRALFGRQVRLIDLTDFSPVCLMCPVRGVSGYAPVGRAASGGETSDLVVTGSPW